jgi:hypothetical protein
MNEAELRARIERGIKKAYPKSGYRNIVIANRDTLIASIFEQITKSPTWNAEPEPEQKGPFTWHAHQQ